MTIARRYLIAAVGVLGLTTAAPASIIFLSDVSSEPGVDPGVLDAMMEFSISGTTLTLTVTNNTADPDGFNMNELYFNAPDGVTLSFDGSPGWSMATAVSIGMFGTFDFGLTDGQGGSQSQIFPAEVVSFTFQITSGAPTMDDFVTNFSTIPPGDLRAIVAAKFVGGPGNDSAYGAATIPAPGVLALLGAAGLVGGRRRRRR